MDDTPRLLEPSIYSLRGRFACEASLLDGAAKHISKHPSPRVLKTGHSGDDVLAEDFERGDVLDVGHVKDAMLNAEAG